MELIKVAVVGVGAMGQNHARVLNDIPNVQLVGVADNSEEQALMIGTRFRVPHYNHYQEMLKEQKPDFIVIASPTISHFEISQFAFENKIHVLVEKPIAFKVEEAKKMISSAKSNNILLGVGHIERFNPAIIEMKKRIDDGALGKIFMIHSKRQSPLPVRIVDVGVGMDLATHELDMMRYITGDEVQHLSAEVSQVNKAQTREDIIFSLLRFKSGVLGVLDVNWVTPTQVREISVTGEKGMFVANYHTQELFFHENPAYSQDLTMTDWDMQRSFSVTAGNMTRFQIPKKEPLRTELESFIDAIRQSATKAPCSGEDGFKALELALQIVTSGNASRLVSS